MDAEVSESAIVGGRADEFRLIQSPMMPSVPGKPQRLAILLIGLVAARGARADHDRRPPRRSIPRYAARATYASCCRFRRWSRFPTIRNSRSRRRSAWRFAAASASGVVGVWIVFTAIKNYL